MLALFLIEGSKFMMNPQQFLALLLIQAHITPRSTIKKEFEPVNQPHEESK